MRNGNDVLAREQSQGRLQANDAVHGRGTHDGTVGLRADAGRRQADSACRTEGKLSLDDDVRKYVSELPDYGSRITLRHLANHTSGLRDLAEILALGGWNWVDAVPKQRALDAIARQKHLNFAPGSDYLYSNSGYYLLAAIVERVSGQDWL